MEYELTFAEGRLGMQVAPARADAGGRWGLRVTSTASCPSTVTEGDEVVGVNGVPLHSFRAETCLKILACSFNRRVRFRRPAVIGESGDAPDDTGGKEEDAGAFSPATHDSEADLPAEGPSGIFTVELADGDTREALALRHAAATAARGCGGLLVDSRHAALADAGLEPGDVILSVNAVWLDDFGFQTAAAIFHSASGRVMRVRRRGHEDEREDGGAADGGISSAQAATGAAAAMATYPAASADAVTVDVAEAMQAGAPPPPPEDEYVPLSLPPPPPLEPMQLLEGVSSISPAALPPPPQLPPVLPPAAFCAGTPPAVTGADYGSAWAEPMPSFRINIPVAAAAAATTAAWAEVPRSGGRLAPFKPEDCAGSWHFICRCMLRRAIEERGGRFGRVLIWGLAGA